MKKTKLELTQYLVVDIALLGVLAFLLLLLCLTIAMKIFFPDVWWLWSWKPF